MQLLLLESLKLSFLILIVSVTIATSKLSPFLIMTLYKSNSLHPSAITRNQSNENTYKNRKMSTSELQLLDFCVSPFSMRVKIALAEKGIEYEAIEEKDLCGNKSELLLKSNPIHKKVPVLLDGGKPICESVVILNYIEDKWPTPALLPKCAYEKSVARFWSDYADKKVFDAGNDIWKSKGEELEQAKKEFIKVIKVLEGALGNKDFFGGDTFGFTDIVIVPFTCWFYAYEQYGSFKLVDECPKFSAWMKRCSEIDSVAKVLPEPVKAYEFVTMIRKMMGIE